MTSTIHPSTAVKYRREVSVQRDMRAGGDLLKRDQNRLIAVGALALIDVAHSFGDRRACAKVAQDFANRI